MKHTRAEFTKPMKKTHTILIPSMLDFHFPLLKYAFLSGGYKCEVIGVNEYSRSKMISAGWEYSNNDVCFPCNLIIGQFICALKSGKYDTAKTALLLPQTGGGCRACNYIMLLRKALLKAGLQNVPVVSLNVSGVEKHSGFSITPKMVLTACAAIYYSDLLMYLYNELSPYELKKGEAFGIVRRWNSRLSKLFEQGKAADPISMPVIFRKICESFAAIKCDKSKKVKKIAITGELYIKFCALGNGETEKYLRDLGCQIYMGGFVPYIMYLADSCTNDDNIYGRKTFAGVGAKALIAYMKMLWRKMNLALVQNGFEPMEDYEALKSYGESFGCLGETMGDGWLIGAEMCSALKNGCKGVVILLPFGCLVSHTCARGIIKRIKKLYPESIITAVDYDSGTADVNIKNRIKMTLDFMDNTTKLNKFERGE